MKLELTNSVRGDFFSAEQRFGVKYYNENISVKLVAVDRNHNLSVS